MYKSLNYSPITENKFAGLELFANPLVYDKAMYDAIKIRCLAAIHQLVVTIKSDELLGNPFLLTLSGKKIDLQIENDKNGQICKASNLPDRKRKVTDTYLLFFEKRLIATDSVYADILVNAN